MAKIKQRIVTKKIKQAVREEKDDHHATVEYEKGPMGPDKQKKTVKIPLKKVDTDRGLSRTPESTQKEIRDHEIHKQHKADGWRISKMSYKNRPKHYRIGSGRPFARYEETEKYKSGPAPTIGQKKAMDKAIDHLVKNPKEVPKFARSTLRGVPTKKKVDENAMDDAHAQIYPKKQAIKWKVKPPAGTKNIHPDSPYLKKKKKDPS